MATRKIRPPRKWDIDDLLALGVKERGKSDYLKAVPILILEKWVREGREEGAANSIRTKDIARRIVGSGLALPFKPKGTSVVLASLTTIQGSRNLTRPPLIEYTGDGIFLVNLPYYEFLLQEYCQKYREDRRDDYKKLFADREPDWGLPSPKGRVESKEDKPTLSVLEVQDDVQGLFAPIEQALRIRQEIIEKLKGEKRKLQAELLTLQATLHEKREVPRHIIADEELRNDCTKLLEDKETYIDAIRRAGVVFEERLRTTLGGVGPGKYGVDLVDDAFKISSGKLIISDHPAEQEGVHMLFRGAVQFVRNPPAHKKVQYTELEAWQTISLIDYLLLLLRQAKPRVS
jgi:uncharacterized protein (TIGR02391 family)